jgi:hypothetical protein
MSSDFAMRGSSHLCTGDAGGTSLEAARIMAPADLAPGAASPEITAPSGRTYRSYAATALMQVPDHHPYLYGMHRGVPVKQHHLQYLKRNNRNTAGREQP